MWRIFWITQVLSALAQQKVSRLLLLAAPYAACPSERDRSRGAERILLNRYIAEVFLELSVDSKTVTSTYYQDLQFLRAA